MAERGRVNAKAVAFLALALALTGCGPVASDPDVADDVESSGSMDDDEGDDGVSGGDEDPSHTGAFFDDGGDEDGTDDGGGDVDGGGGAGLGGDGGGDGEESTDSGEAPPENVACLDVAECLIGQPYAVAPCSAAYDVAPTQCGITPVCARSIEWVDSSGAKLEPPDDFQVSYTFAGESPFHDVGSVCFDPEDGHSCVAPCRLPSPKPVEKIRIIYSCGTGPAHTYQAKVAALGETIQLTC